MSLLSPEGCLKSTVNGMILELSNYGQDTLLHGSAVAHSADADKTQGPFKEDRRWNDTRTAHIDGLMYFKHVHMIEQCGDPQLGLSVETLPKLTIHIGTNTEWWNDAEPTHLNGSKDFPLHDYLAIDPR